ncbi:hypothetical protein [Glutamicibacter sp. MCAF14]|uniref:hypothetical protein n=1 Tax=Glutamicibacter sp. MCAF14 TaxID=3233043 RepID=UPI003F936E94
MSVSADQLQIRIWEEYLDELEARYARMAAELLFDDLLLEYEPEIWIPPTHLGQLPVQLAARVRELLVQQGDLAAAHERRRNAVARQWRAVASVPRPEECSAVYLDATS